MTDTQANTPNATVFTLGQAAKEVGLAKSTVHTAIKNGKLSASKIDGKYEIQAAELFRVWRRKSVDVQLEPAGAALVQQAVLEAKLDASERENTQLKSQLEDTRNERDRWADGFASEQAKSTQYRLDYQREKEAAPAPKRSAFTLWILALIVVVLGGLVADRLGLVSLLDVVTG